MRYSSLKSSENSSAANSIVKLRELFSCFESLSSLVSDNEVELWTEIRYLPILAKCLSSSQQADQETLTQNCQAGYHSPRTGQAALQVRSQQIWCLGADPEQSGKPLNQRERKHVKKAMQQREEIMKEKSRKKPGVWLIRQLQAVDWGCVETPGGSLIRNHRYRLIWSSTELSAKYVNYVFIT